MKNRGGGGVGMVGIMDGGSFLAVDSLGLCHRSRCSRFCQSLEKIRNFWELVSFHVGHLKIDRCQKKI